LLAALVIAGGVPHRVAAKRPAPEPAVLCAARKLAASGGTALADLRCHSRAAAKGRTVEASCLAGPRQRLANAFTVFHRGEPRTGGSFVEDSYVEWNLRRR
jgi:hypothetical protein